MILLLKLSIWFLVIFANFWHDRKGAKNWYLAVFGIRGFASVAHMFFIVPPNLMPWTLSGLDLLIVWLPMFIFQVTSFWIFFELWLNIYQKRTLLYFDTKEKDSGWIDRFFAWAGHTWHAIAKLMALILLVLSIIAIYGQHS